MPLIRIAGISGMLAFESDQSYTRLGAQTSQQSPDPELLDARSAAGNPAICGVRMTRLDFASIRAPF